MAGKKIVNPCARCGRESTQKAELAKEKRVILVCDDHAAEHEEAFKHQKFVLTAL